jgi:predicted aconitase
MELTREEESMLTGRFGEGTRKAMEILVSIGDINDAKRLIDVRTVQISGVSYKTIGDAGLEFLKDFTSLNARVKVLATLNPAGIDLEQVDSNVPQRFLEKQKEILDAYVKLGAKPSCTCTPYLAGNLPRIGEHIAWAESSAVAYANSVIGARTNRESAITALASSIAGKTPLYGLHLDENRRPTLVVNVANDMEDLIDFSTLGYYVGKHFDGIPLFKGIRPDVEGLKALSAGLATGKVSMFHIEGVTLNKIGDARGLEIVEYTESEKAGVKEELNTSEKPAVLCIGCPHCTINEIKEVIDSKPKKDVWIYTARQNRNLFKDTIKNKNIKIISDTCMVVQPLKEMGISSIGTNSAKCAFYAQNLSGLGVKFESLKELMS